ncbi:MAG: hypothetical protein OXC57_03130 [Rhodobacteraceae bacterium]|nr:hypothetical protein [Paracoccaceae bacterium]
MPTGNRGPFPLGCHCTGTARPEPDGACGLSRRMPTDSGEAPAGPLRCHPPVHRKPTCSSHEQHRGIGSRDGEGEAEDIGVSPQHGGSDQPHHHQDGSGDGTQAGLEHAGHASQTVPGTGGTA